jgi:hypothetical protein
MLLVASGDVVCGCGVDGRERCGEKKKADNSLLQSKTRQGKTGRRRLGDSNLVTGQVEEREGKTRFVGCVLAHVMENLQKYVFLHESIWLWWF